MVVKPVLKALLLADCVYTDESTGKDIIAGTFDCLVFNEFPGTYRQWTEAYISITEIYQPVNLGLRYVDVETNEILMHLDSIPVSAPNPAFSVDFHVPVPPLPAPHEGEYAIELHMGNEVLGFARVRAISTRVGQRVE